MLDNVVKNTAESDVAKRAPEQLKEFLDNASDGAALYIEPGVFEQRLGESARQAMEKLGVTEEQLQEAKDSGADLEISAANYITAAAQDEALKAALQNDIHTIDGMSVNEAQGFDANAGMTDEKLKARAELVNKVNAQISEYARQAAEIKEKIKQHLLSIGREDLFGKGKTASNADAVAALTTARINARANLLGVSPNEAFAQFMASVVSDAEGNLLGGREAYFHASKPSEAKNISEFFNEIYSLDGDKEKISKRRFDVVTSKGAEISVLGSDFWHVQDGKGQHPLTDAQWQALYANLENVEYAVYESVRGARSGMPVQVKINTPLGKVGVLLEFLPNGKIFIADAIFNNDAAIDNWAKNKKSSRTLGIDIDTMQNRITGNSSVYRMIQEALGLVNPETGEVYQQAAGLPVDINTDAFRKMFGNSKVVDEDGKPLRVYHSTDKNFDTYDMKLLGKNTFSNANNPSYAATSAVGIWFNENPIDLYDNAMPVYIKIENPLYLNSVEELAQEIESRFFEIKENEVNEKYDNLREKAKDSEDSEMEINSIDLEKREALNDIYNEDFLDKDPSYLGNLMREYLIDNGYDGIIINKDEEFGNISYVVLENTQFKSVYNRGTFDPNNPNIYYQAGNMDTSGQAPGEQSVTSVVDLQNKFRAGQVSAEEFIAARGKSKRSQYLSQYSAQELQEMNARLYLTEDNVGFALTPDGDMINVFNNSDRKGAGQEAVILAIAEGAKTTDCIGDGLAEIYNRYGFTEKSRAEFDETQAPEGWNYDTDGRPDIIFFEFPEELSRNPDDIRARIEFARSETIAGRSNLIDWRDTGSVEKVRDASRGGIHQEKQAGYSQRDRVLQGLLNDQNTQGRPTEGGPDLFQQDQQNKPPRGAIQFTDAEAIITLFKDANKSTILHELGHYFLEDLRRLALIKGIDAQVVKDWASIAKWLDVEDIDASSFASRAERLGISGIDVTKKNFTEAEQQRLQAAREMAPHDFEMYVSDQKRWRNAQEKFAAGFEKYLMEGKAPSPELRSAFEKFRDWLKVIYDMIKNITYTDDNGIQRAFDINDSVRGVMDRLLAVESDAAVSQSEQSSAALREELSKQGFTDEQLAEHDAAAAEARDKAKADLLKLQMKELSEAEQERLRQLRIEEEIHAREQIMQEPKYKVFHALTEPDGVFGFSTADIDNLIAAKAADENTAFGNFTVGEVMALLGQENLSVNEFVAMLKDARENPVEQEVAAAVELAMASEFLGNNSELFGNEADKAAHSDQSMRKIAVELQLLKDKAQDKQNAGQDQQKAEQDKQNAAGDKENARARAENDKENARRRAEAEMLEMRVASEYARKTIDNTPVLKAVAIKSYLLAERRASQSALRALSEGRYEDAIKYKRQELIAHALAKAAIDLFQRDSNDKPPRGGYQIKDTEAIITLYRGAAGVYN